MAGLGVVRDAQGRDCDMNSVLIADRLDPAVVELVEGRGLKPCYRPELAGDTEAFRQAVADAHGLLVRSAARVTRDILDAAQTLRVIGRAGVGVDSIDVEAATARGIPVLNAPAGNTVTTAEHSFGMILALARHIPQADRSLRDGGWERSRFLGLELQGKTLGVVGCGRVGSEVARRALGFGMRVLVHDQYLSPERAVSLGVTRLDSLAELLGSSDIVTLHVPRTPETINLISAERIAGMKPGARLVNCARGGIVDEVALAEAVRSGALAGAALDVFEEEPVAAHPLFELANTVVTPHLGASTAEAQAKVSLQVAGDVCDYLLDGAIANSVNVPSVGAKEARLLRPWMRVGDTLGAFAGQVTESSILRLQVDYAGESAAHGTELLTASLLAALLRPALAEGVNMVSAPAVARARGMRVSEARSDARGAFGSFIELEVTTERARRSVVGTVFSDGEPRIVRIKGVDLEAKPQPYMIYATNKDRPGFVGAIGGVLGEAGVNIATFALGRAAPGGEAVSLLGVDQVPAAGVIDRLRRIPGLLQVKPVRFP